MKQFLSATLRIYACVITILAIDLSQNRIIACAQTANTVVAVVNGRSITQKEIDEAVISQLFPLQQQIYAVRKASLENLVLRVILEDEAKKRGISVEELRKQLTAGKVEVSKEQVEQVYSENATVFAAMSADEAKERLRLDLESQERMKFYREGLEALKKNARIDVRLEEPRLSFISESGAPAMGSKEAPVTIIEFSDFQCPFCRGFQATLKQLLKNYGNQVRLVFKHLPLDIHADAFASAQAAFCAGQQDFFWQYHDALFAADLLSAEVFNKLAQDLGLNLPKFKSCLSSELSRTVVMNDVREARRVGINSTPTFIVNGKLVRGAVGFEEFKTVIEQELKSAQSGSRSH